MYNRCRGRTAYLDHAANVASGDDIGAERLKGFNFSGLQLFGNLRLHQVISTGRAAAEMAVGGFQNSKTCTFQQVLRISLDLLAVLQRTGRVIGDFYLCGGGFEDRDRWINLWCIRW